MRFLCSRYLFSRLGQSIVLPWCSAQRIMITYDCRWQSYLYYGSVSWTSTGRKKTTLSDRLLVFALPIFTASRPATIVGVHVLNFCVRDGNRWTHMTINTNSIPEEVFPFLFETGLRGFLLFAASQFAYLVTHTGFEPMLTA